MISRIISNFARYKKQIEADEREPDFSAEVIKNGWRTLRTEHQLAEQLAELAFRRSMNHESELAGYNSDLALAGLMNGKVLFKHALRISPAKALGAPQPSPAQKQRSVGSLCQKG